MGPGDRRTSRSDQVGHQPKGCDQGDHQEKRNHRVPASRSSCPAACEPAARQGRCSSCRPGGSTGSRCGRCARRAGADPGTTTERIAIQPPRCQTCSEPMRYLRNHPRFSRWCQVFLTGISGDGASFLTTDSPFVPGISPGCLPLAFAQHPEAASMAPPDSTRPPWLQWLILLIFLWSSWQLAGLWFQRLHG